jgi:hypothetical protein
MAIRYLKFKDHECLLDKIYRLLDKSLELVKFNIETQYLPPLVKICMGPKILEATSTDYYLSCGFAVWQ